MNAKYLALRNKKRKKWGVKTGNATVRHRKQWHEGVSRYDSLDPSAALVSDAGVDPTVTDIPISMPDVTQAGLPAIDINAFPDSSGNLPAQIAAGSAAEQGSFLQNIANQLAAKVQSPLTTALSKVGTSALKPGVKKSSAVSGSGIIIYVVIAVVVMVLLIVILRKKR